MNNYYEKDVIKKGRLSIFKFALFLLFLNINVKSLFYYIFYNGLNNLWKFLRKLQRFTSKATNAYKEVFHVTLYNYEFFLYSDIFTNVSAVYFDFIEKINWDYKILANNSRFFFYFQCFLFAELQFGC